MVSRTGNTDGLMLRNFVELLVVDIITILEIWELNGCDGVLNKSSSHRLIYLEAWSPFSGIVWKGLGGM